MPDLPDSDAAAAAYERSISQLRDSARWLLTIFVGLLSVLVAGLSFSSIGDIPGGWDLVAAALSAAIVLTTFSIVILQATKVLGTSYYAFDQILQEQDAMEKKYPTLPPDIHGGVLKSIALAKAELYGDTGASSLGDLLHVMRSASDVIGSADADAPTRAAATTRLESARTAVTRVLKFAEQDATKRQFNKLVRWIVVSIAASALAIGCFSRATRSDSTPTAVAKPTPVMVYLSASGAMWARRELRCNVTRLRGVAVGGSYETPIVAIPSQGRCRSGSLEVVSAQGVAVPRGA